MAGVLAVVVLAVVAGGAFYFPCAAAVGCLCVVVAGMFMLRSVNDMINLYIICI